VGSHWLRPVAFLLTQEKGIVVEILFKIGCHVGVKIYRLHNRIRFANSIASLRVTLLFLLAVSGAPASATTYYVSSSAGNDSNVGISAATAWQTIAQVNSQTFQPGDSVLFKRGDVWNESLVPPSSGSAGQPIAFDAYGTGAAPNLTGYYAVPSSAWVFVSGNAWKASLPSAYSTINFCLFGSIWGQKVSAVTTNLTAQWDFYLANGYVYVFSVGNPALYYNEPIVPMALSNVPVINISGRTWLTFQHFLLNWFDQYGVYVQGTSDHLVFANMEADSMIPQGTQPLGFYVNESSPGPGDIRIYNDEAHLNYDGFRFDGSATEITMVNDKAYANRDGAIVDNTSAVSYSYCHFYASSLAVAGSTDVESTGGTGPMPGAGNIAADTPPAVQVWQRYPAQITLTVDDAGMTPGADTYYADTVLPVADALGVPVGAAITVGYPLAQTLISEFQSWINAGRDVASHSISHTYYTNLDALDIQYIGSGTAASLSISGKVLTIAVAGASDSVSYNLTQGQPQETILGLKQALAATGKFTTTLLTPCQGPYGTGCSAYTAQALLAQDLADVSGQDVESGVYHIQLDVTRLTTDEITLSRQWMTANLTGLPSTPVYVYPGGYETTAMQGLSEGVPYSGARGALKEDLGVKDTYADGFNAENITSFGVNPSWMGIPPEALNQKIQALIWKEQVWGVPWGIFWHLNELTQSDPVGGTEISNLIGDFKANGATIQTNTGLVNWLLGGVQVTGADGNDYYKFPANSTALDFRPTKNSPIVDAGQDLGAEYELDINGVNQNSYGNGWEIGAHVYNGYSMYGGGGSGSWFTIGPQLAGIAPHLPQVWVDNNEAMDGLVYAPPQYELALGTSGATWITGPPASCSFTLSSYIMSFSGLQAAVNAIEACRTLAGVGIILDIPPGLYTTSNANGLVIPQSSSVTASSFLVLRSTQDANLPNGRTVCSHGIQDNLATSTDIGLDNPDCAGDAMYYQLGTTISNVSNGAFTMANGTVVNTSAYDDVQYMWTAESSGTNPSAVSFCNASGTAAVPTCTGSIGPDHWLIEDMEARMSAGNTGDDFVIQMANNATSAAQDNVHIHFRKVWVHGDWHDLIHGANSISAAFNLSGCIHCSIVDSQASQILRPGAEGHIVTANGKTYKIDHNWFEGASISILSGGYANTAGPNITGWVPFQDVEIRRNRLTFPYAWLGQSPVTTNIYWTHPFALVRKNGLEAKEGARFVEDGNIIENIDNSGSQSGVFADWDVWNSSGATPGSNYQAVISDVTFTNNILRNSCNGFEVDGTSRNVGGVSLPFQRGLFANNLLYNASASNPGCGTANNSGIYVESALNQWQGTVTETSHGIATFTANCSVYQGGCIGQVSGYSITSAGSGCVSGNLNISTPNLAGGIQAAGTYSCTSGALAGVTITTQGTGYTSAPAATIALGTGTLTLTINTSSTPPTTGFAQLDFIPGQSLAVLSCPNAGFNVSTITKGGFPFPAALGPFAAADTNPDSLTVNYAWLGATAGASDTSGYCLLSNFAGAPQQLQFTHNTFITDVTHSVTSSNNDAQTSGPNYQWDALLQNDIILRGGWFNNPLGEGCGTIQWDFDTVSLTDDHLVWPGRSSSLYSGCIYGNNPLALLASPVMYFPSTSYCAGATSSPACVGFAGAMNASSMPLTLPDYHGFELRTDSVFYAGNSEDASDRTSIGVYIPMVDAAQTRQIYVCQTACGTAGPWPD
jgi:hypothetical protein